ncbi:MAG TPA: dethiobiotin synthase [bacterium]|nr:dethiobiotin synthase [bacterium]
MTTLFVAATDTGAGKTMVTGLLAAHCAGRGVDVVTQKWVQTGSRRGRNDLDLHLRLAGQRPLTAAVRARREPYALPLPASPHLAARAAGMTIQPARILAAYRALARQHQLVIVEGAGGLLVPYTPRLTQLDLVRRAGLPVLLVVANRLGCVNHALLSLAALRTARVPLLGCVFTATRPGPRALLADNPRIITAFAGATLLGSLPYCRSAAARARAFAPVARHIVRALEDFQQ